MEHGRFAGSNAGELKTREEGSPRGAPCFGITGDVLLVARNSREQ